MRQFIIALLIFLISSTSSFANFDYVLPYPSSMPGSKLYPVRQIVEKLEKYWYFGSLSSYHYNLKYSDKYLVEAKILFEYGQYLLASNALKRSDSYFSASKKSLAQAKAEGKNIIKKEIKLKNAATKHIEILSQISLETPDEFDWRPEKGNSTKIMIKEKVNESIKIRDL